MQPAAHWERLWAEEKQMRATMSLEQRHTAEIAKHQEAEANLQKELQEVKMQLMVAREAMLAGNGKEAELKRQMEAQLEEERIKRVEHLANVGLRRIFQQSLARGWSAWLEMYQETQHKNMETHWMKIFVPKKH